MPRSFPETKGKSLEEMVDLFLSVAGKRTLTCPEDAVFGDQEIPHALETKDAYNIRDDDSSENEKVTEIRQGTV